MGDLEGHQCYLPIYGAPLAVGELVARRARGDAQRAGYWRGGGYAGCVYEVAASVDDARSGGSGGGSDGSRPGAAGSGAHEVRTYIRRIREEVLDANSRLGS